MQSDSRRSWKNARRSRTRPGDAVHTVSAASRHIEEVREARHDLRQHLNLIEHYLQSGKTEDLKTYIEQYRMTLPPDTARTWCENYAVNTVISYYGEEARKASVDFFGPYPASLISPAA